MFVFMAVPKPLLTGSGIHHRFEGVGRNSVNWSDLLLGVIILNQNFLLFRNDSPMRRLQRVPCLGGGACGDHERSTLRRLTLPPAFLQN